MRRPDPRDIPTLDDLVFPGEALEGGVPGATGADSPSAGTVRERLEPHFQHGTRDAAPHDRGLEPWVPQCGELDPASFDLGSPDGQEAVPATRLTPTPESDDRPPASPLDSDAPLFTDPLTPALLEDPDIPTDVTGPSAPRLAPIVRLESLAALARQEPTFGPRPAPPHRPAQDGEAHNMDWPDHEDPWALPARPSSQTEAPPPPRDAPEAYVTPAADGEESSPAHELAPTDAALTALRSIGIASDSKDDIHRQDTDTPEARIEAAIERALAAEIPTLTQRVVEAVLEELRRPRH